MRKSPLLLFGVIIPLLVGLLCPPALAVDVAQQVEATYRQTHQLQGAFVQTTYIQLLEQEQERHGKLYFSRNKFRIEYETPESQAYIFNGETLWIYSPRYQEVEVYDNADDRISREALTFLGGLGSLRDTFKIPRVRTRDGQSVLTLIPRDKESRLKKIELAVDKKTHLLKEATLWPRQGNRSHYVFSDVTLNKKVEDKLFQFKVPKNVAIIRP